ncbi:MAG: hypothetical protein V7651_05490 [Hyphomonas oceanitis]|uniref:hypothetical protein n=1 Tax=Hyphomonas oceanitis TaxID=81033 RepID=UPI00300133CB
MAERKPFIKAIEPDVELVELLAKAKDRGNVTDAELLEQRISFAYGNAPESKAITKESIRKASKRIRLVGV